MKDTYLLSKINFFVCIYVCEDMNEGVTTNSFPYRKLLTLSKMRMNHFLHHQPKVKHFFCSNNNGSSFKVNKSGFGWDHKMKIIIISN